MIARTVITPLRAPKTVVEARGHSVSLGGTRRPIAVTQVTQGIKGPPGPPGPAAFISTDPENTLSAGTDGGLYAPPPQLATSQW